MNERVSKKVVTETNELNDYNQNGINWKNRMN